VIRRGGVPVAILAQRERRAQGRRPGRCANPGMSCDPRPARTPGAGSAAQFASDGQLPVAILAQRERRAQAGVDDD
jgi:hypothetical protein